MRSPEQTEDKYLGITPARISELEERFLFPTYKRSDLFIARGSGAYLYDMQGRRYLDLLAGIAVNSLGYNHPRLMSVLAEQGSRVMHGSNLFYHPYQGELARRLTEISGMARVFFTNSGTEAIEGALKIARAYARRQGREDQTGILALKGSFHGRTFGALSITAQEKYQAPFRPLLPGVTIVPEITVTALEQAFHEGICALVLEPIQGESGIVPLPAEFLRSARSLCDRFESLLVVDEIQSGMGRTGKYFSYQHYGVKPDVVTVAKSLAAGYPLGAILGSERVAGALKPGDHGTTFGGGPLACRLALEALDIIEEEGLLEQVVRLGEHLMSGLRRLADRHAIITDVRGMGLMVGVEVGPAARQITAALLERGFVVNAAHDTVLRLLPPFIVTTAEIDSFVSALEQTLEAMTRDE